MEPVAPPHSAQSPSPDQLSDPPSFFARGFKIKSSTSLFRGATWPHAFAKCSIVIVSMSMSQLRHPQSASFCTQIENATGDVMVASDGW
jgi:hypothetical protein